jgi:RNA polymerase sigma factor (sigma-70 family)
VIATFDDSHLHSGLAASTPALARLTADTPESCIAAAKPLAPGMTSVVNRSHATIVDATTEPRSDHALMIAVRDGELDALGELFERHHGALFGFLVKFTGQRVVAEDVVQTVFQRMLKYRHTYRDDGSFSAWMYHLARRCAADHFRRASTAPQATDPVSLQALTDDAPDAGLRAATSDDHALLHVALGRLNRDDREVLLLARFQELSFAEIAAILECSVGAAKVRAHRALNELRDAYFGLLGSRPRIAGDK